MPNKPNVKVWLSHDGYRDPDDNLSMLIGGAQAWAVEKSNSSVSVAAIVFGDTRDGGQYYMLNPGGKAPKAFGGDPRYGDKGGNKVAAGNHEFFQEYAREALRELAGGWSQYDLLASDDGGRRAWNFDASSKSALTAAAAALATDIEQAIAKGGQVEVVVYSAGGGANLPAEALGYLLNQGYDKSEIKAHFAIVQHGRSNWGNNYEDEARDITNDFTIALSNQNMARYRNGMDGPDLKHALKGVRLDGDAFGDDFAAALAVATGRAPFRGLDGDATFRSTADASDAGSHAFAVDIDRLMNAWDDRMGDSDSLPNGDAWAHRIAGPSGDRLRVIYNEFDAKRIADLLDGRSTGGSDDDDNDDGPDRTPSDDGDNDRGPSDDDGGRFRAPFATSGSFLEKDGARLFGFAANGRKVKVVEAGNKIGLDGTGDGNEIDRQGKSSERLAIDFGDAADAITLRLAGLGSTGGAEEAARLTAYEADGSVLDAWVFQNNGRVKVDFDAPVRYAALEAVDRGTGNGHASESDFALVSLDLDFI